MSLLPVQFQPLLQARHYRHLPMFGSTRQDEYVKLWVKFILRRRTPLAFYAAEFDGHSKFYGLVEVGNHVRYFHVFQFRDLALCRTETGEPIELDPEFRATTLLARLEQ